MKVKGLDGREYPWSLAGRTVNPRTDETARSGLHLAVRELLRSLFPTEPILEEVSLPGTGGLEADFYLPVRRLIIEADGVQHTKYIAHFHGSRSGWIRQQKRDRDKEEWAELNGLRLVRLSHDEDESAWKRKLL